jgi:hypothetical protein
MAVQRITREMVIRSIDKCVERFIATCLARSTQTRALEPPWIWICKGRAAPVPEAQVATVVHVPTTGRQEAAAKGCNSPDRECRLHESRRNRNAFGDYGRRRFIQALERQDDFLRATLDAPPASTRTTNERIHVPTVCDRVRSGCAADAVPECRR